VPGEEVGPMVLFVFEFLVSAVSGGVAIHRKLTRAAAASPIESIAYNDCLWPFIW
jgi:hypothetical protein